MSAYSHRRPPLAHRLGWWRTLHVWQRVLVVAVLLGVLVIAAGLLYVAPLAPAPPIPVPTARDRTVTHGPRYPPGTDEFDNWGQNKPLDQQP